MRGMISKFPEGWLAVPLSEIAHEVQERNPNEPNIPVLSVTKYDGFVLSLEYFKKQIFSKDTSNYKLVRKGQFAYATIHLDEGSIDLLDKFDCGLISPMYTVFEPDSKRVNLNYLRYQMKSGRFLQMYARLGQGSINRRKSISFNTLESIIIPLPPIIEQQKITAILSSVDEAIASTQAVIDQTRKVKQGLLQQLLTRGIGHTKFKESAIGKIPKEWKVVRLESLLANIPYSMRSGPFGSTLKKEDLVESGIPFLGIDNIHRELFIANYKRFISEDKFKELKRYAVREEDVVITIMGTVGRSCVLPFGIGQALSSKHLWTMTFDRNIYRTDLICWQLNYAPWVLKEFNRTAQGGVMSAINAKVLRNLLLPLPPKTEQDQIVTFLTSAVEQVRNEENKLASLKRLKCGLMQDLLTGKVRVGGTP